MLAVIVVLNMSLTLAVGYFATLNPRICMLPPEVVALPLINPPVMNITFAVLLPAPPAVPTAAVTLTLAPLVVCVM